MKSKKCALFLFDGYADWEPALVIAGLNKYSNYSISTFSFTNNHIKSMGGISVRPESSLKDIEPETIDILILPGGDVWEEGGNEEIIPLIQSIVSLKKPLGAICGATIALGKAGILNSIDHTSNGKEYLKQFCPQYKGDEHFKNIPCVSSQGIITANGAAMVEFAHEIYKELSVFDQSTLDAVTDLYKSGGMNNRLQG